MGKVYFVGAGPGDPGLITVRGAQCLVQADVVLYDYLASPLLLAHTRPGTELICLGRHGHGRQMSPEEVVEAMLGHARAGRIVVRLKGGDPTIFARLTEELAALHSAGIAYEIVPGVTAALAASSHAEISLTNRDCASCVALVTGQEAPEKSSEQPLDFAALAKFPGTLVFYMGVTTADDWSARLMEHGKPADTPVAIVRRCSLADQQTLRTTLQDLPEALSQGGERMRPPAIVIVGDVARDAGQGNWFTSRPLFGRTILVTRPGDGDGRVPMTDDDLTARLRDWGANVLHQPAILVREPADWSPVDAAIERLAEFDWLVFTSANGVGFFLLRLFLLGHDARSIGRCKLAVVGAATEDELLQYYLSADICPAVARAESLIEELTPFAQGQRFLLVRGSRGREVLAEGLRNAGGQVEQVVVYESVDIAHADEDVVAAMAAGQIHWTTVTSSAIARNLVRLFGEALRKTRLVSISPLTADTLRELGFAPAVVADEYNAEGIAAAIESFDHGGRSASASGSEKA